MADGVALLAVLLYHASPSSAVSMTIGQVPLIRDFFSLFERDALVELEKDFYTNSKANAEIMQSQNNNE